MDNQPQAGDLLDSSVRGFASAVAAKTPTPGGGSVAGVVGSMAVALGEMSLNFTLGKKKYAQHEPVLKHLSGRLMHARSMFQDLVADDMAAYGLYREASGMADGPEKDAAVQLALAAAINVPREMAKLALAVLEDFVALSDKCNTYLISDLVAGAALLAATVDLCDYNVRVNVPQLNDGTAADDVRLASRGDVQKAYALKVAIEQAAAPQIG